MVPSKGSVGRFAIIPDADEAEERNSGKHYLHRHASR
jgi:hypothetical protein